MIKDRNIAKNAFINPAKIRSMDLGDVFYVSGNEAYRNWLAERVPDGNIFPTIAGALEKVTARRNDYVVLGPGGYTQATTLDLSSLTHVHIVGAAGLDMTVGTSGPAYIVGSGAYPVFTLGDWCEIAGLQIWNYSGEEAITWALKQGNNVHHNFFRMTAYAGIVSGVDANSGFGNNYNRVHHNKFHHYAGTAGYAAIRFGLGTGNDVDNNEIIVYGGCVYDVGIVNMSAGAQTNFNIVSESGGSGASGGGTVTIAVQVKAAGTAIGNRLAVGTTQGLDGGTASHSFVDNKDAQAGGATEIET